ncbi:hypothetical protein [Candidatus Caldatribacterium sp.]|uniref:hypothetical protein n=1 Tax=Candidatus Caldatribacterium sp. TaxID=2282143 RepID=UPI002995A11A|nr:hypothetical protein [Candidatus Caldatribacterium sp.]MDW8080795.1 hypothetical protein [Candidatus Calescibacterium sp.]
MLLDALFSTVIGMMVICGAFGVTVWCLKTVLHGLENVEEREFALSALHTVFNFIRYGNNVVPTEYGRKLSLYLGKNQVTLYRLDDTLLLSHRGTANPIAEQCTETNFVLSGNLLTSTFVFGDTIYVLQVVSGCFTR